MWEVNFQKIKRKELTDPLGYSSVHSECQGSERQQDLQNKAWSIATSGFSNIFMTMFMMYMIGSGLNIFTLLTVAVLFSQSLTNLFKVGQVFAQFENKKVVIFHYQLVYLAIHAFQLTIGLYRLYTIGLLPLNAADWIEIIPYHKQQELVFEYNYN